MWQNAIWPQNRKLCLILPVRSSVNASYTSFFKHVFQNTSSCFFESIWFGSSISMRSNFALSFFVAGCSWCICVVRPAGKKLSSYDEPASGAFSRSSCVISIWRGTVRFPQASVVPSWSVGLDSLVVFVFVLKDKDDDACKNDMSDASSKLGMWWKAMVHSSAKGRCVRMSVVRLARAIHVASVNGSGYV